MNKTENTNENIEKLAARIVSVYEQNVQVYGDELCLPALLGWYVLRSYTEERGHHRRCEGTKVNITDENGTKARTGKQSNRGLSIITAKGSVTIPVAERNTLRYGNTQRKNS